ncbi:hypothetical protein [Bacillus piscicola]|nr:hypothetical protein [Bacillus piscicola]
MKHVPKETNTVPTKEEVDQLLEELDRYLAARVERSWLCQRTETKS